MMNLSKILVAEVVVYYDLNWVMYYWDYIPENLDCIQEKLVRIQAYQQLYSLGLLLLIK